MPLPDAIGGVLIAPLVAAIIELFKAFGMPVKYAGLLNVVLSLIFWAIARAFNVYPEHQTWIAVVLQVAVIILTAAGFYEEVIKRITKRRFNRRETATAAI
ncbi:MAG: hypothetical protein ACE5LU_06185 [Anaerolineae bacterium]